LTIAKTGHVVFVSAEILFFGGSVSLVRILGRRGVEQPYFNLKEQNCWLITCHTISSEAIVEEI